VQKKKNETQKPADILQKIQKYGMFSLHIGIIVHVKAQKSIQNVN